MRQVPAGPAEDREGDAGGADGAFVDLVAAVGREEARGLGLRAGSGVLEAGGGGERAGLRSG